MSPAQLGDRLDLFKSTLRSRLSELDPSGVFTGETSYEVLIGTRS